MYLLRTLGPNNHLLAPLTSYQAFFQGTTAEEVRSVYSLFSHALSTTNPNRLLLSNQQRYLVFHDPSALPQHPGWPLRNALHYLSSTHNCRDINVVALREGAGCSKEARVWLPSAETAQTKEEWKAVGWEKNEKGKLGPRVLDLGASLDPARLIPPFPLPIIDRRSTHHLFLIDRSKIGWLPKRWISI